MKLTTLLTKTKKDISTQETSINAQLLERAGYISKVMSGVYSFLPLGLKVLTKIENIVREEMEAETGQELLMPGLLPKELWLTTGRWDKIDVLYKLVAHDRDLCLGPTHEEVVTPLVTPFIRSYKDLPKAVFQIQTKYRNEARPKSGLLRGREFRMKDLYSFHSNEQDLDAYYEQMIAAYLRIFKRCGLADLTYLTYASGGIFSKYSHEFQTITPYGEDIIHVCNSCKIAINKEIISEQPTCPQCSSSSLEEKKSIEVGNIFKLKTRFSEPFKLNFADAQGKDQPVIMGCYGVGTSRLVGSVVEALHDAKGIVWPKELAPYSIYLIGLGKEDELAKAHDFYIQLKALGFDVLYDDRPDTQAGAKFADADLLGIPLRIVISRKTLEQNKAEIKLRISDSTELVDLATLGTKVADLLSRT